MNLRSKLFLDYYFGGFLHAVLRIPTILLGPLLGRHPDLSKCREIAILKLLGGGSLVIAYPALLALRRLPGLQKLTLITTPAIAPFADQGRSVRTLHGVARYLHEAQLRAPRSGRSVWDAPAGRRCGCRNRAPDGSRGC